MSTSIDDAPSCGNRLAAVLIIVAVLAGVGILIGALLGLATGRTTDGRVVFGAILLLGVVPGVLVGYLAKSLRYSNIPVLMALAAGAGAFTAYPYLSARLTTMHRFEKVIVSPQDFAKYWPRRDQDWVTTDQYSGETVPVSAGTTHWIRIGMLISPFAGAFVSASVFGAAAMRFGPRCPSCKRWLEEPVDTLYFVPVRFKMDVGKHLRAGNTQRLQGLIPTPDAGANDDRLEVKLYRCAACQGPYWLTADEVVDACKGEMETIRRPIAHNLRISDKVADCLIKNQQAHEAAGETSDG